MGKVYVGTSGWMYEDWQGKFYPQGLSQRRWLEYYSRNFKTVEVNSTFYHQMKQTTFENWAKTVSGDFVFAVKGSRFITHIKRLRADRVSMSRFLESAGILRTKLGPILFQCPPRFKADGRRLEAFLKLIQRFNLLLRLNLHIRLAFEFRDISWFDEEVYHVLRKYNAALVIAESGSYWPSEEVLAADFAYIRFHGEGGSYATSYTDQELKSWAKKIKKWQKAGVDVYAYFNNDVAGFAIENARTLVKLIS